MMSDYRKKILVVTKDPSVVRVTDESLVRAYGLNTTDSVLTAEGIMTDERPDLVMLDLDYEDCLELLVMINGSNAGISIPVLILAGQEQLESLLPLLEAGAEDILLKPLAPEVLKKRVTNYLELNDYREADYEFMKSRDAISVSIAELVECRDLTTGGHLKNTTAYFKLLLGEIMQRKEYKNRIAPGDIRDLIRSVPLHDIGKIGINDDILRKASSLNSDEFEFMKTHTILGKKTFDKIMKETGESRLLLLARDLSYCHHERWDGTGYPNGLKGEEIPFYARILAIVDVYDALTSRRTYKEAFSHEKAVNIISEGKGSLFDPDLVDVFLSISDKLEQLLNARNGNACVS
jgi:putative two-component system response regulator